MDNLPTPALEGGPEGRVNGAGTAEVIPSAHAKESLGARDEKILSRCGLDGSLVMESATVSSSPRVESNICNNQIAVGKDMNAISSENTTEVSQTGRGNEDDEDEIAAGMVIPALPPCILERETQHHIIATQLLSTPNAKVAILGMGGIGKTTLACRIAYDSHIMETYPRRLFLSFEGCSTPDLAYTKLATAFQIAAHRRTSHGQILSHVLNYLKQKKTLLIIDNFETFWEVSSNRRVAEEFLGHLAALSELAIIVTLRGAQRPRNIRWFKIDPLPTLTQHGSKELLFIIADNDYTDDDLEYVQQLLDAVAGIPLAVTLIGSLLRDESETPQSLWRQWVLESATAIRIANEVDLDDRLYKLDISLRISIFGPRMSDHAKEFLAAISVLPTGLNASEEWLDELQDLLPSTIQIRSCIRTLRDVALATLDLSTSPPRLRLLSPTRDFCLSNMSLDSELSRRLIDMYNTDLRKHWEWGLDENYDWMTTELSNATAVLNHALALQYITDSSGDAYLRYTDWLRFLCVPQTDTIEQAIDILSEYPKSKADCLQALGLTLTHLGREAEAIQYLEQALIIHRDIGPVSEVAWDLYCLGDTYFHLKEYAAVETYLNEARDLYTEMGRGWGKGAVLLTLSDTYRLKDMLPQAESTAQEALELCRASGNRQAEAIALRALGDVYCYQNKHILAIEMLTASVDASKVIHDTKGEARANQSLGDLYSRTDQSKQAALHFQLAIDLFDRCNLSKLAKDVRAKLQNLFTLRNTPTMV